MATGGVILLTGLCLLLCIGIHAQDTEVRDPLDTAWQLSFDGLEAAGCLPDDFIPPDISPCVEQGSTGGPAMYQALICVAERFEIYDSTGLNINRIYEMIENLSSDDTWVTQQKKNVDICKISYNTSALTTPEQHGIFMLTCLRRIQNQQCRLSMMQQLEAEIGTPGSTEVGQLLVLMLDGGCVDTVKNSKEVRQFSRCTAGTSMDFNKIKGGIDWAKRYTNVLVDASSTGAKVAPPSEADLAEVKDQLELQESGIICTMRETGLINNNGSVNYANVLQSISESSGESYLKQVKIAVVNECRKQESNDVKDFIRCYFWTTPYACTSLYSHFLVLLKGHVSAGEKESKVEGADVATTLSFDGLEAAGCLPDDFSPPDLSACVKQGSAGGPALYQALECVAERFGLSTNIGLRIGALYDIINSMSTDKDWVEAQRRNVDICDKMMNTTVLKTVEKHGVFLLFCQRRIQQHQCQQQLAQRLGANTGPELSEAAQQLARLRNGGCMDSVTNAEDERAFEQCTVGTEFNMGIIVYGMKLMGRYAQVVNGKNSLDELPESLQIDAVTMNEQLELLDSAILCTMRTTGGLRSDDTIDFTQVQRSISESTGRPELIQLQAAVVEGCRKQGVTDGRGFLECYYNTAPYACNSLKGHVIAVLKGWTPKGLQEKAPADADVATTLSFDGLEAAGCLPDDFSPPDISPCVEQGSAGGPALYQALECVTEKYHLSTCATIDVNDFYSMVQNMSEQSDWTSQQRDNINLCKAMMNTTILNGVQQQAVFMLSCTRRLQQYQCRLTMTQQLKTKASLEGAVKIGQRLVKMAVGGCMESVRNPDNEKAYRDCTKDKYPDMSSIIGAMIWAKLYTSVVEGAGSVEGAEIPSEDTIAGVQAEIQTLESAILCTMRTVGEIRSDDTIDFTQVQKHISESTGRPELIQLQAAVVEGCRKQGVTDGAGFLECYFDSAPYACHSLQGHVMVLLKGHHI